MEWILDNHLGHRSFSSLGIQVGDIYVPNDNCLDVLSEIQWKLSSEDKILRPFRRAINFSQALQTDFIPLLVGVKDAKIKSAVVKILVNVLVPVECLLPPDVASNTDAGRITAFELNSFLMRSKTLFREQRTIRAVVEFIKTTAKIDGEKKLSDTECEDINNCLLLLRNILHIPESCHAHCTSQNQIVWNLFVQNIDKVLLHLMTCEQKSRWGVAMVQLIAVLYKDQDAGPIQKLLSAGFEGSSSGSSEDNESNTMQVQSGDSSPVLTSPDTTSDSSDSCGKQIENNEGCSGVPHVAQIDFTDSSAPASKMLTFEDELRKGAGGAWGGKREIDTEEPETPFTYSIQAVGSSESKDQSGDSSPVLTLTDSTSESSDSGGKQIGNHEWSSGVPYVAQNVFTENSAPASKMLNFEDEFRKGAGSRGGAWGGNRGNDTDKPETLSASSIQAARSSKPKVLSSVHHRTSGQRSRTPFESCSQKRQHSLDYSDNNYVSQMEAAEANNSTSSNEDENIPCKRPVHVKPHNMKTRCAPKQKSPREKKEMRRKRLMKKNKSAIMKVKALANHVPTDEDITDILKEFTIDFLLKGYDPLVAVLHNELMSSTTGVVIDTSQFFWLLTYFLKFAGQLELDIDCIREGLSYRVISYLVYEGVRISENVETSMRRKNPELRMILRRQHLDVTAIREFILSVVAYTKFTYLTPEDKNLLQTLKGEIASSNDLKCLFVLLLRQYNPDIHSKQYLEDLVVTNHIFMLFLENVGGDGIAVPHRLSVDDLVKQFASPDVIKQYGLLLEDYKSNTEYTNDCVLTMMHHIGGEMNQVASLCQPNILKTFTQIWESDFQVCDDWSDLIEYVIHRFVNIPRHCPMIGSSPVLPVVNNTPAEDSGWPKEECENLYWYFYLSSSNTDRIANIIRLYEENGVIKTRIGVIDRLMKQGVVNETHYKVLLDAEAKHSSSTSLPIAVPEAAPNYQANNDVDSLREALLEVGMGTQLLWIQRVVLETCYVKFLLENHPSVQINTNLQPFEPIPYYFSLFKQAVPVVPWNADLAQALRKKTFQSLLRNLGFHLPSDQSAVFIRIPSFWSPDILLRVAQKLGPLDPAQLKFDIQKVSGFGGNTPMSICQEAPNAPNEQHFLTPRAKHYSPLNKQTPLPTLSGSWLDLVKKQSKKRSTDPKSLSDRNEESLEEVKRQRLDSLVLQDVKDVGH